MQHWFSPSWRKRIATLLSTALLFGLIQGFTPLAHTARALDPGPAEERQNPWPELTDQFVLEPFPSGYPATGPDGALPNIISKSQGETALRFALPGSWVTPDYKESTVDYSVAPSDKPAEQAAIHTETVAAGGAPAYAWNGGANKDGLYLWSYQTTPVKGECPPPPAGATEPPPPCAPNFDATPATGGPFPVMIDRQAPAVVGLQGFKDGWLGVEVKDQVSGIQRVEAAIYVAGQEHLASIPQPVVELAEHPRHAVVHINLAALTVSDWMVKVTVTDFAGNQTVERMPLEPMLRPSQLGTGAPWLNASAVIGGQPQRINMVTGNGFFTQAEASLPVQTMDLNISRAYNHQNRQTGLLGWGWRLSLEANLRLWPGDMATWQDPSGTIYTFKITGTEATPYVDGVPRAWPRLSRTADSYQLRWQAGDTIRFDAKGEAQAFADSAGQERITYVRQDGKLTEITTSVPGRKLALTYDGERVTDLAIHRTDSQPAVHIAFAYTDGNLTRVQGIDGQVAEFAYDDAHRLTAITNVLKQPDGEQRSEVHWEYGAFNRLTGVQSLRNEQDPLAPDQQVREFRAVDYQSGVTLVTDPLGTTQYAPDGMGRPAEIARNLGKDSSGNPIWRVERFRYQGHRLTGYTDPIGRATTYAYDNRDSLTEVLFPDGETRTRYVYAYTADDRVQRVDTQQSLITGGTEKTLTTTTAAYEAGRLAWTVGPKGSEYDTTNYNYNADGLLASTRDPYGYVKRYDYNEQGLVSSVTDWPSHKGEGTAGDADAQTTEITYDGLGRVLTTDTRLAAMEHLRTAYAYDAATGDPTITQYQPGSAVAVGNRDIRTQVQNLRTYLPGSRPVRITQESLGLARQGDPGKAVTTYTYNTAGRPTEEQQPGGSTTFKYDAMGLLRSQAVRGAVTKFDYDAAGRLTRQENPRGGAAAYDYDLAGQLLTSKVAEPGAAAPMEAMGYAYDPLGRVKSVASNIAGTTTVTRSFTDIGYGIKQNVEQADPITGSKSTRESEAQYLWSGEPRMERTGTDYRLYARTFMDPNFEVRFKRPPEGATGTTFTEEQLQLDHVRSYRVDGRGRATAEIQGTAAEERPDNTRLFTYDGLDRLITVLAPADENGERKHEYTYAYDADGQAVIDASDAGVHLYTYSTVGNLLGETATATPADAAPQRRTIENLYDANHRLTTTRARDTHGSITEESTIAYDDKGNATSFTRTKGGSTAVLGLSFNDAHDLVGLSDGQERWGINYDTFGRPNSILPPGANNPIDLKIKPPAPAPTSASSVGRKLAMASTSDVAALDSKPLGERYSSVYGGYLFTQRELDGTESQVVIDGSGNIVAVVDQRGQVTKYAYTSSGRLSSRTDAKGQTTSYTYDSLGRMLTETDAKQNVTRYTYEENGRKVTRTDAAGNTEVTRTTLLGKPLSVTDGNGHTTSYEYDAAGQVTRVLSPTGDATTFAYDADGGLISRVDPRGGVTTYTRDGAGRVVGIMDPEGHQETVTYNAWGKVASYTNKEGEASTYTYSDSGRLTATTDPLQTTTGYERDARGQVTAKRIDGHESQYAYNERGWLTHVEEPGENGPKVSDYSYDEVGRLKQQATVQADGQVNEVSYAYDELGRVSEENFGDGLWTKYTYDRNSNVLTQTSSNGLTTTFAYDQLNRLSRKENGDGTWTAYTYDGVGNKLTESNENGTTTYTYTPDNRLASETGPGGSSTEYEYDGNGNIVRTIKDGKEQEAGYDQNNRVTEITDGLGFKYQYEYDRDGYVTAVHLPNGLTTHSEYDERHNVRRQWTDSEAGATVSQGTYGYEARPFVKSAAEDGRDFAFVYDGRGQMKQVTNERGDVIRYAYDGAGNLTRREAVIGGASADYGETITVDELMVTILTRLKEQDGDANDKETAGDDGGGGGNGDSKPKGKDKPGDSASDISSLLGKKLAWGDHRIADVWPSMAAAAPGKGGPGDKGPGDKGPGDKGPGDKGPEDKGPGDKGPEDKGPGNGKGDDHGNAGGNGKGNGKDGEHGKGPKPKHEKPSLKGCNGLEHGNGKKLGLLRKCAGEIGLDLDKGHPGLEANLLGIIDNLVNGEYYLPPGDKEEMFALVREVAEGYTIVGTTYTYNAKNQLQLRHNLVRDEEHRYSYDLRGNMTSNGRSRFTWDEDGRLTQTLFPDGEGVRYTYDALGRRSTATSFNHQNRGLHVTTYEYEGNSWNVVRERNKDGEVKAGYTYDLEGRPLTITYGGETFWYVYNAHGDVVSLTDSSGAIKARYEYDEWGRVEAMYDEEGRVREGYGTIGDIGTGPTRPVIGSPTPGSTKAPKKSGGGSTVTALETTGEPELTVEDEGEVQIQGVIGEPTDLVKANPYRYGGYRYDRETQYYYLRVRYYDGRLGRFLSLDTHQGQVSSPLTLNRYIYVVNNPANYLDPTGHRYEPITYYEGDGDTSGVEPEDAVENLNKRAEADKLHAIGFTREAISYYGVDLLMEVVQLAPVPTRVLGQLKNTANQRAADMRKLGIVNVAFNRVSDPIYQWLQSHGPLAETIFTSPQGAGEQPASAVESVQAWQKVGDGVVQIFLGGLEVLVGVTAVGLGCATVILCGAAIAGGYAIIDGGSRVVSGVADIAMIRDTNWKAGSGNLLRSGYQAVLGDETGAEIYELAGAAATAGAAAGIQYAQMQRAPQAPTTKQQLSGLAKQADQAVPGNGPVNGTLKHSAFKQLVDGLGDPSLETEITYHNGGVVDYGTKGAVRLDVVQYDAQQNIVAVYDLKTGTAALTTARIQQIRSHLPPGMQGVPVIPIRP